MRNGRSSGPPGWLFNTSPRRLIVQPLLLGLIALLPILEGWHGQPRWAAIVLTVALAGGVIWIGLTVVALWRRPEWRNARIQLRPIARTVALRYASALILAVLTFAAGLALLALGRTPMAVVLLVVGGLGAIILGSRVGQRPVAGRSGEPE